MHKVDDKAAIATDARGGLRSTPPNKKGTKPMIGRRKLLAAAPLAPFARSALASTGPAAGDAPMGVSRFRVGAFSVTAISDGFLPLPVELFPDLPAERYDALLEGARFRQNVYTGGVAAFLVEAAGRRILIDAGTGPVMGPTLGRFKAMFGALGFDPSDVDLVLATHLHPDHIGGLIADGDTPFVNAEIVVGTADAAFWTDHGMRSQFPEGFRPFFDLASGVLDTFEDRLRMVSKEADVSPGITAVPLPGHTPGHMGYRIESEGDVVLMWGDVVHAAPIQLPQPAIGIVFDVDQQAAAQTRKRTLDMVVSDRMFVIGSHLPFPGFGAIERSGDGFRFIQSHWEFT
ncbi:MAG: MBL fold metallo-hydrolase [Pseudomonadota bacterium]